MAKAHTPKTENMQAQTITFLSLGGEEDVTRNMYLYEYTDQIFIVDCGLGFPDESMLGVDLLLPDIAYLLQACMPEGKATKKIVGMLLTHGHEDHIGGLPFILPQLPSFPIYGSPLTAALARIVRIERRADESIRQRTQKRACYAKRAYYKPGTPQESYR